MVAWFLRADHYRYQNDEISKSKGLRMQMQLPWLISFIQIPFCRHNGLPARNSTVTPWVLYLYANFFSSGKMHIYILKSSLLQAFARSVSQRRKPIQSRKRRYFPEEISFRCAGPTKNELKRNTRRAPAAGANNWKSGTIFQILYRNKWRVSGN